MLNGLLTFVLGALAVMGVIFALQTINRTRELRMLQIHAAQAQAGLLRFQQLQALANEAAVYNQKNPSPDLTKILNATHPKPAH